MNTWPDQWYHTSQDRPDKLDPSPSSGGPPSSRRLPLIRSPRRTMPWPPGSPGKSSATPPPGSGTSWPGGWRRCSGRIRPASRPRISGPGDISRRPRPTSGPRWIRWFTLHDKAAFAAPLAEWKASVGVNGPGADPDLRSKHAPFGGGARPEARRVSSRPKTKKKPPGSSPGPCPKSKPAGIRARQVGESWRR